MQTVLLLSLLCGLCAAGSLSVHKHPASFITNEELHAAGGARAGLLRNKGVHVVHDVRSGAVGRGMFRAGSSIQLAGGILSLGAWALNVSIGTPPVSFSLLFDTGSSNLAVSDAACSSCGTQDARYSVFASSTSQPVAFGSDLCNVCSIDPSPSAPCEFGQPQRGLLNSSLCGMAISYGGGQTFLGGNLVYDSVTLGEYTVTNGIVSITEQLPAQQFGSPPFDGIIGFAYEHNSINPTYTPTIFHDIVRATGLPDMFATCLTGSNGGILDLGEIVPSRYSGEIQWIPVVQERWYDLPLIDVQLAGQSIGLPYYTYNYVNDQIGSFIDSGTSVILLGPLHFQLFQQLYQSKYCDLPGVCGDGSIFANNCITDAKMGSNLPKFPAITFVFGAASGNVQATVPASSYLLHQNGQYCLGMAGVPGINAVLGGPFLENYYTVHDRANKRVGIAPVAECA